MLTIEAGDFRIVRVSRQGAVLMLAVVVLWTALPGFACFLSMPQQAQQPSCCMKMAPDCAAMRSMGAAVSGNCCQAQEKTVALMPVLPYAAEQLQWVAVAPDQILLPALVEAGKTYWPPFETPPPKSSSGASFTLRV